MQNLALETPNTSPAFFNMLSIDKLDIGIARLNDPFGIGADDHAVRRLGDA